MESIGALLIVLALVLLIAVFLAGPFLKKSTAADAASHRSSAEQDSVEHKRSSLLAERDRILTALQELDFDHAMGKVPEEDYPSQRSALLMQGTRVLRQLETFDPAAAATGTAAERIEAAVAEHRADAMIGEKNPVKVAGRAAAAATTPGVKDDVEEIIARRKRERKESAAGFCPRCGRPVSKSDKFCSKCGTTL